MTTMLVTNHQPSQRIQSDAPAKVPDVEERMDWHVVSVRLSRTLKERVDEAVEESGLTLADWLRAVVARAANEGAFTPRKRERRKKRGLA